MTSPIKTNTKPKSSMKIDNAPTPHNTPASVLNNSYLRNGNPVKSNNDIPTTISEEDLQSALENVSLEEKRHAIKEGNPLNDPNVSSLLFQSIQDKLGDLIGTDSGYLDNLSNSVKERILGLKSLQVDLYDLEKQFQIEMFELENKYLNLYKPLYERRFEIVNGLKEPTKEQIMIGQENEDRIEISSDNYKDNNNDDNESKDTVKGIPAFWLTALENLPIVNETITDRDAEVLNYLEDIRIEYLTEGKPGFKLIFKFNTKENPFFTNEYLVKTYYYQSELGYSGDFIYDHAEGDVINWTNNASNVTVEVEMRKQRNKTTKQVRTIEKLTPIESFFNFFDPPKMNINANGTNDEDEDEDSDLEARLALDYSIGEQLKDKLIPRAVDWFTGTALEFEYDEGVEDEEDYDEYDEDEQEGDNNDDDDDDDESDDFAQTSTGKASQEAPECKQS